MRLRARVDANTAELDDSLEALGWLVVKTHQLGQGFPDRVLIKAGRIVLAEYKDGAKPPSRRRLSQDEHEFHQRLTAAGVHVHVFETVADLAQLDRESRARHDPEG